MRGRFPGAAALLFVLAILLTAPASLAKDCSKTTSGHTPINDLGTGTYNGSQGGLYPGGSNVRPLSHDQALDRVGRMRLLNAAGEEDVDNGLFVLMSIGNSNTDAEWQYFLEHANANPQKNDKVMIVNGCQTGKNAAEIANPEDLYWGNVDEHLAEDGLTPLQVQAIWLEESVADPTDTWPDSATTMNGYLRSIVQIIHNRFPNVRAIYHHSRIYGGYGPNSPSPEPWAYEYAFSTKWLIEQQMNGDPGLNFDPAKGPVMSPWNAWGPYTWADGLNPRSDGLIWECVDFRNDGKHPSDSGKAKVFNYLINFFLNDATTTSWFRDCDLADTNVFGAPPEVHDLKVERLVTGVTRVSWTSLDATVGKGAMYDLVDGTLAALHDDQGYQSAACRARDVANTPFLDTTDPVPGDGFYYLVRARTSCGSGTFGDSSLVPDPRDLLDSSYCQSGSCGDAIIDAGEQCDGVNLGGQTCLSLGYRGGALSCSSSCTFDTSNCSAGSCGDGRADPSEECDGTDLDGKTCLSLGFDGGVLECGAGCEFDTSGCTDCGNGIQEAGELCDGTDLDDETCVTLGYLGGTLACSASCAFDTASCSNCGDGTVQADEQCDGSNLDGETCQTQGYLSGTLACSSSCDFDYSSCSNCGDSIVQPPEDCDNFNLNGATCVTLGYSGGVLACTSGCTYNTTNCTP